MWSWSFAEGAKGNTAILIQRSALSAWFSQRQQHVHGATGVRAHITERWRILRQQVLNLIHISKVKHIYCYIWISCIKIILGLNDAKLCLLPWFGKIGWILKVLPHAVALLLRLWFFFCDQEGQFSTPALIKKERSVYQIHRHTTQKLTHQHEKHIYINNFELPQVLNAVQGAVAARQEVVQILSKTQSFQPWGQRGAAVTPQSFHLKEEKNAISK